MQVFAYITSVITQTEQQLELSAFSLGHAFSFVSSGITVQGSYVQQGGNKFDALDAMRKIYADPAWKLRFELV